MKSKYTVCMNISWNCLYNQQLAETDAIWNENVIEKYI